MNLLWVLTIIASGVMAPQTESDFLESLKNAAEASHTDSLLLVQNGRVLADWTFGQERQPIELMSVLKSIVALGIGRLITLDEIASLDQPVYEFYPEFQQGRKREITIRHLLNHTSGLQDVPNAGAEIYPSPDAVKLALAAELSEPPGTRFRYNNKATNLLAGIIEVASGQRMDMFFADQFFGPMEIHQYKWYYDRSGRPHAMAGLELLAADLAKFGQLVLDQGRWGSDQLISADFIYDMLSPSQPYYEPYGLLWWRLPRSTRFVIDELRLQELRKLGATKTELGRLRGYVGKPLVGSEQRDAALLMVFGEAWRQRISEQFSSAGVDAVFRRECEDFVAYYGDGYLGQTLMVLPEQRIIAVRQIRDSPDYNQETDVFSTFKELVLDFAETSVETPMLFHE